ncbi:MAG: DUF1295 domain-containing protein [Pikeienuella sp.]
MDIFGSLLPAFAVSLGVFIALWPISVLIRDVSIVDAWWGPGFLAAVLIAWDGQTDTRTVLLLGLVGIWALRLGIVMIRRRLAHGAEDSRYQLLREGWGASFWWKSLFVVFLLQGILQCIIALPPLMVLSVQPVSMGILGVIGGAVAFAGLALEAIADHQLDAFKRTNAKGEICKTGLRAHVRHPNYTGEMIFWFGIWLIATEAGAWWTAISPLLLVFLLTKVSGAPMLMDSMSRSRPGYVAYTKMTPAFLPKVS